MILCAVVNLEAAEVILQKRESFVGANFLTDTCWQGSGSVEPRPIEAMHKALTARERNALACRTAGSFVL